MGKSGPWIAPAVNTRVIFRFRTCQTAPITEVARTLPKLLIHTPRSDAARFTTLEHIDDKCDIGDGDGTEHERIRSRHYPERSPLIRFADIPSDTNDPIKDRQRWYKGREGRDDRKYEEPFDRPDWVYESNRSHRRDGNDVTDFHRSPCHEECWNLHNIHCVGQFE
jgi:hypothetical protein